VSSVRFYGSEILISRKMILKLVEGYKGWSLELWWLGMGKRGVMMGRRGGRCRRW
jgi:hypothetical protein